MLEKAYQLWKSVFKFDKFSLLSIRKYTESKLFAKYYRSRWNSLENSEVKVVEKNIKIGKGCYVESLEYSESIEIDEDSIVGEIKNIVKNKIKEG